MDTDEFAARVAAPLKAAVDLDPRFEARVMHAVADAALPWWRRRRTVTLGPPAMLAAAAAVVLLVAGALNVTRRVPPLPIAAATTDTVFVVRFVFAEAAARQVFLAGDFNGWSPTATPLERADAAGHFSVAVTLPGGLHEYAFIVDGERWTADPYAVATRDEFGNESSVILVGGAQRGS